MNCRRVLTREERVELKSRRDAAVRSGLTQLPAGSEGGVLMKQEVELQAWRSHLDGATVDELAEQLWRSCGYVSAATCRASLVKKFARRQRAVA